MRFEGGSASSSGRAFSCILLGRLNPIPYTPFSSSGRLVIVCVSECEYMYICVSKCKHECVSASVCVNVYEYVQM